MGGFDINGKKEGEYRASRKADFKPTLLNAVPEENNMTLKFKIYEDGIFKKIEKSEILR